MELIGRRFGHIRVTEVVGQGGMGDVYAGYDETLERKVALKVLNADQRLDDEARERLLREARALSKLEHPNICRIHDYIDSGDVDLLVLEYIDGRTLSDAMTEGLSRAEKLRISSAICEVLVTAHRAGIVHRDLKPENVMLTKSGEVKVLDFGLARWLNRARAMSSDKVKAVRLPVVPTTAEERRFADTLTMEAASEARGPSSRREFLATAVGITLGTPLYMSPEQARGEVLTPASDMFSFGLLMQTLFTGIEPHPADVTAREAILRVARGETVPVTGAPGDVTTLINRLKKFAPTDRPTAVETGERLHFMADRPQRIARRGAVAAIVAIGVIGGWRYTVDLKHERSIAVAERAEAQKRRGEVEDLLEFMLGDLRQKLEPVGRLEVLNDVAERALAYSASLRPEQLTPEELVRNAKALHQLAQVRIAQGNLHAALAAAQRASTFTDAAALRDRSPATQLGVATSEFWIANVHRLREELPQALKHAENYRRVTATLAASDPSNRDYQMERDYGEAAVATILELQGDFRRAAESYEISVARRRERVSSNPSSTSDLAGLAVALNKLGYVRQSLGELRAARKNFEEEFSIYSRLATLDPTQQRWRDRLINSHSYLGALLEAMGEDDRALEHRREEVSLGLALHEHDPANADWQRNLAIAHMRLGDLLRRKGDVGAAVQSLQQSEALLEDLLARKDARKSWRKDAAVLRIAQARAWMVSGRADRAESSARWADTELTTLAFTDPLSRRHAAEAAITLGEAQSMQGHSARATAQWSRAESILRPIARSSSDPLLLDIWSRALLRLGRADTAAPVLSRLDQFGYHSRDLDVLRVGRGS